MTKNYSTTKQKQQSLKTNLWKLNYYTKHIQFFSFSVYGVHLLMSFIYHGWSLSYFFKDSLNYLRIFNKPITCLLIL